MARFDDGSEYEQTLAEIEKAIHDPRVGERLGLDPEVEEEPRSRALNPNAYAQRHRGEGIASCHQARRAV